MTRRLRSVILTAVLFAPVARAQVFDLLPERGADVRVRRFGGAFASGSGRFVTGTMMLGGPMTSVATANTALHPGSAGLMPTDLPAFGEAPRELAVGAIGSAAVRVWLEGAPTSLLVQLSVATRPLEPMSVGAGSPPAIDCDSELCLVAIQRAEGGLQLYATSFGARPEAMGSGIALAATPQPLRPAVLIVPGSPKSAIIAVNVASGASREVLVYRGSLGATPPYLNSLSPTMIVRLTEPGIAQEPPSLARITGGFAMAARIVGVARVTRATISGSIFDNQTVFAASGPMSDVQLASNADELSLGYLDRTVNPARPAVLREQNTGMIRLWAPVRQAVLRAETADRVRLSSGSPPLLTFDRPGSAGVATETRGMFVEGGCVTSDDCVATMGAARCMGTCSGGVCGFSLAACVRPPDAGVSDAGVMDTGVLDSGVFDSGPEDVIELDASGPDVRDDRPIDSGVGDATSAVTDGAARDASSMLSPRFTGGACSCAVVSAPPPARGLAAGALCVAGALVRRSRRRRSSASK